MMDPLRSDTCWSTFKYFVISIVSTYYILSISCIIKCLISLLLLRTLKFPEIRTCETNDEPRWVISSRLTTNSVLPLPSRPEPVWAGWRIEMFPVPTGNGTAIP